MAEERAPEAQELEATQPAPVARKKPEKKLGKMSMLFWLILLGIGTAAGMHLSGFWDGRPLLWGLIPKIPSVGPQLAEIFHIPSQYSLTVNERRALELSEWQKRLDERERIMNSGLTEREQSLLEQESALDALSGDIQARMRAVQRRETEVSENPSDSSQPTPNEQELMNQVARTYQDMSARNAAAVVEQMRDSLAVELLMKLPNEARASILGKMKPQKAARLTDLMSRPKRR